MTANIKTVGIKDLKNNLSGWLREIKSCRSILVTDRGKVVAEIQEPAVRDLGRVSNPVLAEWIREGRVRPGKARKLPPSPVRLASGTSLRLLNEERGE